MDYARMSFAALAAELSAIGRDADAVFGGLDERRLNWKPDAARWSVAQCVDHLLNANREMFRSMDAAVDDSRPRTVWQRLPVLPWAFGRMLIASQGPKSRRKFTAPRQAEPSSSAITPGIIERFVRHQDEAIARVRSLEERNVGALIMVSPFVGFITYSVLDGCRIVVTHERRHFAQARRVMQDPRFPRA